MTSEERNEKIKEIFKGDLKLLLKKGHDYAGDGDCMQNLRDFGFSGVIVRIGDKYSRLRNFIKQETLKVQDESIIDTLRDLRNYAFLAQILYEGETPDSSVLETTMAIDHPRCFYCGGELKAGDLCIEIEDEHICHVDCRKNQ